MVILHIKTTLYCREKKSKEYFTPKLKFCYLLTLSLQNCMSFCFLEDILKNVGYQTVLMTIELDHWIGLLLYGQETLKHFSKYIILCSA